MDLRKRLAQLDRLTRKSGPEKAADPALASLPVGDLTAVLSDLGLVSAETTAGLVWYRDYEDELPAPPVLLPDLEGFFTRDCAAGQARESVLLVDTETTGLAGGTGTLVFLLGCSWWGEDRLITRQFFLPGPGEERPLLLALAELAANFGHVMTYNGASFDLPLLRARALLNRLDDPLANKIGWDLVVPARRLWRYALSDCRQQTIEAHLAGKRRAGGDIDGSRIPQTWFDFLHSGRPGMLGKVLTHNHRDMLGMARIFGAICNIAGWLATHERSLAWPSPVLGEDRSGAWALGRLCERRGDKVRAAEFFRRACRCGPAAVSDPVLRRRFTGDALRNLKRQRCWDLVEELIADGLGYDPRDLVLHTEAAILYEHRLVDRERALRHAVRAGDKHRIARLSRLIGSDRVRHLK